MTDQQLRDQARRLSSKEDVLCLHAICQPAVTDLQNVIRFQRRQLDQCERAILYLMVRLKNDKGLGEQFLATESYRQLTNALAEITNQDVDALCESILPGSSQFHRRDEEAA